MRRILLALVALVLLARPLAVSADQYGDFTYTNDGSAISITGYTGAGGAVVMPGVIDGVPVTSFEFQVFGNRPNVTSVTIPSTVLSIPSWGFAFCSNLTTVVIPNGLTNIGSGAFVHCNNLTSLAFPASLTNIPHRSFDYCVKLLGIFMQGNAKTDDVFLFSSCTNATVYYLPGTTGWTNTFGGHPAVLWNPLVQTDDGSLGMGTNGFGFNITGTTNIPIVVEAAPDVVGGNWVPLLTNTIATGSIYFSDPDWTNRTARFYRIRSP